MKRLIELSRDNHGQSVILPINPPSIQITAGQKNQTIDLLERGEILALGNSGLASVSLASFFPAPTSPFFRYADREPLDYYNLLDSWRTSKSVVRLIISGAGVNLAVAIEELTKDIQEGDRDLYYTIKLKEYRRLNVPTIQHSRVQQQNGLLLRPDLMERPQTHIVRSAEETFWYLACKYYGDGSQWKRIATANGRQLAYDVRVGDRVTLP